MEGSVVYGGKLLCLVLLGLLLLLAELGGPDGKGLEQTGDMMVDGGE